MPLAPCPFVISSLNAHLLPDPGNAPCFQRERSTSDARAGCGLYNVNARMHRVGDARRRAGSVDDLYVLLTRQT